MSTITAGALLPIGDSPVPSLPRSSATFGHPASSRPVSASSDKSKIPESPRELATVVPEVNINGSPIISRHPSKSSTAVNEQDVEDKVWGSNFWVTLVNPQTQASFYACPATGQVSWDPPVGNFVLPPNPEGEWWEICDESRGGIPYYYQTKTGETVWERPEGFVIPLGILQQNTALGRRLSQTTFSSYPKTSTTDSNGLDQPGYRRSRSYIQEKDPSPQAGDQALFQPRQTSSARVSPAKGSYNSATSPAKKQSPNARRSFSNDQYAPSLQTPSRFGHGQHLPPIPGSPYATDVSSPSTPTRKSVSSILGSPNINGKSSPKDKEKEREKDGDSPNGKINSANAESISRARSKSSSYLSHRSPPPQSLSAAVEMIASADKRSTSDNGHGHGHSRGVIQRQPTVDSNNTQGNMQPPQSYRIPEPSTPTKERGKMQSLGAGRKPPPVPSGSHFWSGKSTSSSSLAGKDISGPMLNQEAALNMSPVKSRQAGKPIPVDHVPKQPKAETATLSSGTYPILPHDLASDIQQFVESDFARQYFSTHRTGFIFRRKVPVAQMMTWQKASLNSPLLTVNRSLNKDAVKIFKVIQHLMGDRERDRSVGVGARVHSESHTSTVMPIGNGSSTSLPVSTVGLLEEERWLLGEGLTHGELRDEIFCQLMKQLSGNPNPESVFKGWQLMCVLLITFPPSKNFETYLQSFMQQRTTQQEGRVDVMAKYCLRRLVFISRKGPRGKPPTIAEIETASDAAFNPSTFGESLDAIIRLQERNYPHQKVPIILPFLADGILALGGTKSEGIFRVPGDGDSVSELKLRIDRGYYTLENVDDPHVLASLLKLWLRELCDPLVPEEMYNECITSAHEPEACVRIVERLPTINRRVVLFVISFLQLFLEEKVQSVTKMTPANLALVMAPNLLRCNSESMAVVFTNAQYEQIFVYHLLLHLKCNEVDASYIPTHGLGATIPSSPPPRTSRSRPRRPN